MYIDLEFYLYNIVLNSVLSLKRPDKALIPDYCVNIFCLFTALTEDYRRNE